MLSILAREYDHSIRTLGKRKHQAMAAQQRPHERQKASDDHPDAPICNSTCALVAFDLYATHQALLPGSTTKHRGHDLQNGITRRWREIVNIMRYELAFQNHRIRAAGTFTAKYSQSWQEIPSVMASC